jgi:hypothetical protein
LLEVVAATEALQQLDDDVRIVVAHACFSAVVFCYWQHAEAKSTRLYELNQQLVQTSLNLFIYIPTGGDFSYPHKR